MRKSCEILKKEILNLTNAVCIGKITKIYFDKCYKKVRYLLVENDKERYLMEIKDIYKISDSIITVKNQDNFLNAEMFSECEFIIFEKGAKAYTSSGIYLGECEEIIFSDKFLPLEIIISGKSFPIKKVLSASGDITVIKDDNVRLTAPKKIPKAKINSKVKIVEEDLLARVSVYSDERYNDAKTVTRQKIIKDSDFPDRIIASYEFLLGREVIYDIKDNDGNLLVEKGTYISEDTINAVKESGKLAELTANSIVSNRYFF